MSVTVDMQTFRDFGVNPGFTGLLENVGRSDQSLEWTLKVLGQVAPVRRIELQAIHDG
jgi:hypothetical protein